jgi:hypothetical protein
MLNIHRLTPRRAYRKTPQENMQPEISVARRGHAILCAVVLFLCVLLTHPVAEMGMNDDWSYIRTAQVMTQTGHLVYNGWATAMLGWQVLLGALFIRIFGFSFTVTRIPIFLVALVSTFLLHRVLARFGLNAWNAALATLTIVLSAAFLPLVFSFMSDVGGFFALILCLYACQRALQERSNSAALSWLYFAALSNIATGTVRQIAWLGVLVMVPSTAWLLRKRKSLLVHGIALWIVGSISVHFCMKWFAGQPNASIDNLMDGPVDGQMFTHLAWNGVSILLSILLFLLPVMITLPLRIMWLGGKRAWLAVGVIALVLSLIMLAVYREFRTLHTLGPLALPWLPNLVTQRGILQFGDMIGQQPDVLPMSIRVPLSILVVLCGISCAVYVLFTFDDRLSEDCTGSVEKGLSWTQTTVLLLPFSLAYLALLVPRAAFHSPFDRYLTPLMVVFAVFLLRYLQQRGGRPSHKLSYASSFVILLVFTFFAVAGTHDLFAQYRAHVIVANEVTESGVPRTELEGGFEYNGWTQILTTGYVTDPYDRVPGAPPPEDDPDPCHYSTLNWTPAIRPEYALSYDPVSCYKPSHYPPVEYRTWLPPHAHWIYVQQVH